MRIVFNNNVIEVQCQHCKSTLAVTVDDIHDNLKHGTHVVCDACKTVVPVSISEIPKHWRQELDWE